MVEYLGDILKAIMAGLLALLWWDIRKIRGERIEQLAQVDEKLNKYVTLEKHQDLCQISTLAQNADLLMKFDERLDTRFKDMKDFIEKNGFK